MTGNGCPISRTEPAPAPLVGGSGNPDAGQRVAMVPVDLDELLRMQGGQSQPGEVGEAFPFAGLLAGNWRQFLVWFCAAAVLGVAVSFAFTPIFKAEATFIPVESGSSSKFAALLGQLGGMGLPVPGVSGGKKSPGGQLAVVLSSRALAEEMFRRFPELPALLNPPGWLASLLGPGEPTPVERLAMTLQELITVTVPRKDEQPLVLAVEVPEATMAARLANAYMEALASYVNQVSFTNARKSREYIEAQVEVYRKELTQTEETLKAFQETHRVVSLSAQANEAIRVVGELKGRLLMKDMEREVRLKTTTPNHPEVTLIDDQIAALKAQLQRMEEGNEDLLTRQAAPPLAGGPADAQPAGSVSGVASRNTSQGTRFETAPLAGSLASAPQLMLDFYRRRRDVEIAGKVFELLMQQLALARITEQNEAVTFQVIDLAVIPWKKVRPKRSLFALVGGFLGILACGFYLSRRASLPVPESST